MTTLNGILLRTQELLSKENLALVHRSLVNLEQTTGAVADQRAEIATLISNLTEASRESTAAVRQANSTLRDANLLLNNDGKQIMVNTRDATASLERAAFRVETLLQNNQESLNQGLAATGPAMHELQQALANLNTVLRRLDRNPAQYLLGGETLKPSREHFRQDDSRRCRDYDASTRLVRVQCASQSSSMVTYKLPDYHIAQAESTPRAVPGPGALRVYAPESSRVLDSGGCSLRSPMVACRLGKECVGPTPHRCCCVTESSKPSCAMGGRLP